MIPTRVLIKERFVLYTQSAAGENIVGWQTMRGADLPSIDFPDPLSAEEAKLKLEDWLSHQNKKGSMR